MPFNTGLASVEAAVILDSGDFPAAFDQALAMVDYPAFAEKQEATRPRASLIGLPDICPVSAGPRARARSRARACASTLPGR